MKVGHGTWPEPREATIAYDATHITADGFAVSPSDTTNVTAFGFYVGNTGGGSNVVIKTADGTTLTFVCTVGTQVFIAVSKFMAATTATNIIAYGPT